MASLGIIAQQQMDLMHVHPRSVQQRRRYLIQNSRIEKGKRKAPLRVFTFLKQVLRPAKFVGRSLEGDIGSAPPKGKLTRAAQRIRALLELRAPEPAPGVKEMITAGYARLPIRTGEYGRLKADPVPRRKRGTLHSNQRTRAN